MIFGMGIFANGVSRLLIGSPRGIVSSLLGGYLTALVRPHVTVLLLVAAAGAVGGRYLRNRLSATFLMVVLVSALSGVISSNSIELLPSFDSGFNAVLSSTREISSTGGSEFETASPNGILDYPVALVTVLFRPFLFEAGSGLQLLAAAESTALIVVIIGSRYRLAATIRSLLYVAYLRFSLIFVLGFGFAWASIGNYGILVRQRAQVMPFVLLLVFGSDLISQRKGPMEQILEARK
jgi:hypothetical protein